ncbi:MAG: 6-carboxytetrahydropterin synthase [Oligoflexales bacterium]|nr:6-carboxytetrahydropterin synthase [Oligoflexales bacterium]
MIVITKVIEWDMGHRVPNHQNKCRFLHGHRYRLELSLSGSIQSNKGACDEGMICDFADIKKIAMEKIHDVLDHMFMAHREDPLMQGFEGSQTVHGGQQMGSEILFVPFIPTAENIVIWCYEQIQDAFSLAQNKQIRIHQLRLYETPNSWADYFPPQR